MRCQMQVPTLLQLCMEAVAQAMPLHPGPTPESLPDEALVTQLYDAYMRVDEARRRLHLHDPRRHLAALQQFAVLWQPAVLLLTVPPMPGQPGVAMCAELQAFSSSLCHLELTSASSVWLSGLQGLSSLACLSLRNCPNLSSTALQQALQQLPQLTSLDLCGLAAVSDALAPSLVNLTNLVVLQLNRTSCGNATVEWLTYGCRLQQWHARQHGHATHAAAGRADAPFGSQEASTQQWPRTTIRSWHLAYTHVTPKAVDLLSSCPDILLLDLRGSGVKAAQLAPLRARFALSAVQGAVLSRTAALVLAAVTLEQFVCVDAAQHGAAAAAIRAGPQESSTLQWVNCAVDALLQAAAEVAAVSQQQQYHHYW